MAQRRFKSIIQIFNGLAGIGPTNIFATHAFQFHACPLPALNPAMYQLDAAILFHVIHITSSLHVEQLFLNAKSDYGK